MPGRQRALYSQFVRQFSICALAFGGLVATSCVTMPETYAPPIQRDPIENPRPYRFHLLATRRALFHHT